MNDGRGQQLVPDSGTNFQLAMDDGTSPRSVPVSATKRTKENETEKNINELI